MNVIIKTQAAAIAAILALALSLGSCAALTATVNPIFGESATADTRSWAEKVFLGFNKGWIPALGLYRAQAQCAPGVKAPCWEPDLYKKLHSVTDAATACQVAATAPGVDILSLSDCVDRVSAAKLEFTQNGISPIGVAP